MFVACGIWCLADVSSVSPSSEQTYSQSEARITVAVSTGNRQRVVFHSTFPSLLPNTSEDF